MYPLYKEEVLSLQFRNDGAVIPEGFSLTPSTFDDYYRLKHGNVIFLIVVNRASKRISYASKIVRMED